MCEKLKIKNQSKTRYDDPTKTFVKIKAKLLTAACKSKVVKFKSDEDTLQHRFYLLFFINSFKVLLSHFR